MKVDRCFLCDSEDYTVLHYGVRDNESINVLKCNKCGLVRLSDVYDDSEKFYKESGMREHDNIDNIDNILKEADCDDKRRYLFTKKYIFDKSICDFGCGAGGYLQYAKCVAKEIYGVEIEDNIRNKIKGFNCYNSIDKIDKVDVITLFHVLEHFSDPCKELQEIKKHLNNNGIILVEVPNANDALLSLYGSKKFAAFTYWSCHAYLYDMFTLSKLFAKINMKPIFIRQIQRYSLANHMYWLSNGLPGGHKEWFFLEDDSLNKKYGELLSNLGIADTIIAGFKENNSL